LLGQGRALGLHGNLGFARRRNGALEEPNSKGAFPFPMTVGDSLGFRVSVTGLFFDD